MATVYHAIQNSLSWMLHLNLWCLVRQQKDLREVPLCLHNVNAGDGFSQPESPLTSPLSLVVAYTPHSYL